MNARVAIVGIAALALVCASACRNKRSEGDKQGDESTSTVLPASPVAFNPKPPPAADAHNLHDMMIQARTWNVLGTVGGKPVTTAQLDKVMGGAFRRIGKRIHSARRIGYRWLVEQAALKVIATKHKQTVVALLQSKLVDVPEPTQADLAKIEAERVKSPIRGAELTAIARTLWRQKKWEVLRSVLVQRGLKSVKHRWSPAPIQSAEYAKPSFVVAMVDGKPVTRMQLRLLAGYQAEMARHEYYRIAKFRFEKLAADLLIADEAKRAGKTVKEVEKAATEKLPPTTKADVDAYIARQPQYAAHRERARDQLRRIREINGRKQLVATLTSKHGVTFDLREPKYPRRVVNIPGARVRGDKPIRFAALHALGCGNCKRGSQLVFRIMKHHGDRLTLIAGDYFSLRRMASYRGALALRCAGTVDNSWKIMQALVKDFGTGEIGQLVSRAKAAGIEGDFQVCLESDRFLPTIWENLLLAERLGLERSIPGLFVNGVRLERLGKPAKLEREIKDALGLPPLR